MEEIDSATDNLVFTSTEQVKEEIRENEPSLNSLLSIRTKSEVDSDKVPPPSRYYCNKCNYNTYHRSAFEEHLNRHKGIKPYKCELCPFMSVSKNYTKKHQDKHITCVCGFVSLKNRTEFKRHVKSCSKIEHDQRYTCSRCGKEFVDDKGLASHISRIKTCDICSDQCCALKMHKLQVHGEKSKIEHKKERFECCICGWSGSLDQKILLHLVHHPAAAHAPHVDVLRRTGIIPH